MNSPQWFAVKRYRESSVVYLMVGGDRRAVEAHANELFNAPVIQKLTWSTMSRLTGCRIPGNKAPTEFCRGEIWLFGLGKFDIVIKAI